MADIKSSRNWLVKEYRLLKSSRHRKEKGKMILEGAILLEEALRARLQLENVLYTREFDRFPRCRDLLSLARERLGEKRVVQLEEKIFDSIAQTENPQGVAAIAHAPRHSADFLERPDALFLILDGVQDPGNLGAMIRSAAAGGVDGMVLLPDTVDPFNPKALRAGMGGTFFLPVVRGGADFFHDERLSPPLQMVAATPQGELSHYAVNYTGPTAIIVGNETRGIGSRWLARAHVKAFIPLRGEIASLNAAVAASVFVFEALRQRESGLEGAFPGDGHTRA